MLKTLWLFAVLATLAAPDPSLADGMRVEPGLWELVWSIPDPLGGQPLGQRQRTCVRDPNITAERANSKMTSCRVSNVVVTGPTARWKMRCESPAGPMTGTGKLRSNGKAVEGSVDLAVTIVGGFEIPVTGTFKARRMGTCAAK